MALSTTQYGYIIDPMVPFTDEKGKTIKNGFVRVFVAGSSTPVITYRNFDGAANQDLIELDNSGRTKTSVIGSKGLTYKVCVYDKHHSQESPILTVDKVSVIGANITAGTGATVVTGLDGLTKKPDGFVDASVVGTDGYVALDHTLVEDDLDTDAKATAVENDRYIPLLNDDVNDPDSKMTLGRLWQWVLGKIKSLSTTITSFRSGDYIPVDGPSGTAKMAKDDLQNTILIRSSAGFTDINDFNNNGIYSVNNTLANYPTGAGNGLLCVFTVGASRKIQILQSSASSTTSESEVWYRSGEFGSNTWAKWEKIVNDNTFNSTAINKHIFVQFNPLQNTDLNDCVNSGYYCLSSLYTWTNKPTGFSYGFMLVFTISSRTEQVVIDQLNDKFFFRSIVSGTWSNWNEISTKKYVDDEITAVNSSISQLEDRIDDIVVYPDNVVSLYDLPSVQVLENTNGAAAGVVNPYVNTSDASGYRTFIYFAGATPIELYFDSDIITNASYLAVSYGLTPTGTWESVPGSQVNEKRMYCSSSARKRKSESNLPTSSSKLTVPAGSILLFTTASSDSVNVHINCFAELNPDIGVNTPTRDKMSIKYVSSTLYKIKFGDFECELYKTTNVSTDADNWNVGHITRNGETIVSKGTDIIGPIKISGDDDFIGGVHGSETTNDIYVYSGSKKLTLDSSLDEPFEKLTIMMNSTCRRESDASDAFSRRICVEITRDKMHLSSEFICISSSSLTVERVTNGGLIAAYNRDILGCYMNNYNCDGYPLSAPNNASKENTHAVIVTDLGTIEVNNIKGKTEQNYKGLFALFAAEVIPRTKVYFDVFNGSKVVSNGDKFYGEAEYIFEP